MSNANNFNVITIDGHGSKITPVNGFNNSFDWAKIDFGNVFIVSNLVLEGYETPVYNSGICIFNNVTFKDNNGTPCGIMNLYHCVCNNCTFTRYQALCGSAIYNEGGLILNNVSFKDLFVNNGSDIYNCGNAILIRDGEVTFNSNNARDSDYNISYGLEYIFDYCKDYFSYKVDFLGEKIDIIHLFLNGVTQFNNNTILYSSYGKDIFVTVCKDFGDGIIYKRIYSLKNISAIYDIFPVLLKGNYDVNASLSKNLYISNQVDYDNALNYNLDSFNKVYEFIKTFGYSGYVLKVLNINFAKECNIQSNGEWNFEKSKFDFINFNGNGSLINGFSAKSDENKWLYIYSTNSIVTINNLMITEFNQAIYNLGCACILNNVTLDNNKMDYYMDPDYGAGINNYGLTICNNCTFSNNYCKKGGAIFSNALLYVNNCTFINNKAYGVGNNILNVNDGEVYVNGTLIEDSKGIVQYRDSVSEAVVLGIGLGGFCTGLIAGGILISGFELPIIGIPLIVVGIGVLAGTLIYTAYNSYPDGPGDKNYKRIKFD